MQDQKKEAFINAMLESKSITEASEKAGISRSTAYIYLKDEEVKKELASRRSELLQSTTTYLQNNLYSCSEELMKIVKDKETPQAVKVQAINSVFNNCKNLTEQTDIITRLQEIEEKIKTNNDISMI